MTERKCFRCGEAALPVDLKMLSGLGRCQPCTDTLDEKFKRYPDIQQEVMVMFASPLDKSFQSSEEWADYIKKMEAKVDARDN